MFHHDQRDYRVAASQAAQKGRDKLQGIIDAGRANAQAVVEQIQSRRIHDLVAATPKLRIVYDDDGTQRINVAGVEHEMHPYAYKQVLADAGVRKDYSDYLAKEAGGSMWGKELLATNVNTIFEHRAKQRNLVRIEDTVDGKVKGFLSDKYRRLDSRPLCDAFMGACMEHGLVPIDGLSTDTKCRVRAVLPYVFEPTDNEVMVFGTEFGNSDYGDGGMVVNLFVIRIWCTNLAVTEKCLRQIHLGGKLPDNLRLSERTYRLDAETTASAVSDVTGNSISPDSVHYMLDAVKNATEEEIRGRDGINKVLERAGLDKTELGQVTQLFESPDVQNMPAGNNMWRLSNAVSWFAQMPTVDTDRKLALQDLAGRLVVPEKKKVLEA